MNIDQFNADGRTLERAMQAYDMDAPEFWDALMDGTLRPPVGANLYRVALRFLRAGNTFTGLLQSTRAFHERFDLAQDYSAALRVFEEEVAEFRRATWEAANGDESVDAHLHAAEEAADVIVTMLGLMKASGIEMMLLVAAMSATSAKNDAKTHATHTLNSAGKVVRKDE